MRRLRGRAALGAAGLVLGHVAAPGWAIAEPGGGVAASAAFATGVQRYRALWSDPAVERRIADGIERYRKSSLAITVVDRRGRPIAGATVRLRQVAHDFTFGANGFMVGGFADASRNARWEASFARLFNTTTVPFYWRDFEPRPGAYRIDDTAPEIYRRPPVERVLQFARRWGLATKGHVLVWQQPETSIPAYWPADAATQRRLIDDRIRFIGETFGSRIGSWDVVNEVVHSGSRFATDLMPADYPMLAFTAAAEHFPRADRLILNEATPEAWDQVAAEATPYYLLASSLIARGAKIDAIGLQMHYFEEREIDQTLAGTLRSPTQLFGALDLYARLGRSLQITEVTIPALDAYGGELFQAEMARNLYRLWFSHPAVTGITWWNLADGTAYKGEDRWHGGLLHRDALTPKPAFAVLDQLINHDWRSDTTLTTDTAGSATARVFQGSYRVEVKRGPTRWSDAVTVTPGAMVNVRLRPH